MMSKRPNQALKFPLTETGESIYLRKTLRRKGKEEEGKNQSKKEELGIFAVSSELRRWLFVEPLMRALNEEITTFLFGLLSHLVRSNY